MERSELAVRPVSQVDPRVEKVEEEFENALSPVQVLLLERRVEEAAVMVKLSPRLNDWPLTLRSWPVM